MPLLVNEDAKKQPRLYAGKYPSVTEVLSVIYKPHIEAWRKRVGNGVANKASNTATQLGTKVHAVCERIATGEDIDVTDAKILQMGEAYRNFLDEYVDEILFTEKSLISESIGIGGTLDVYARLKGGKHAIIDIKTSKNFEPEMGLQMAGYMLMTEEQGFPVDARLIVRLSKDKPGKFYVKFYEDHEKEKTAFKSAVILWRWRHRWPEPGVVDLHDAPTATASTIST